MTEETVGCPEETEVGAIGGDLRYWLAKEGLRQTELRLSAQPNSLQAMETRATSILTWSVSIGLALVAAWVSGTMKAPAVVALLFAVVASVAAAWGLWPRPWTVPGQDLRKMRAKKFGSELEHLESMALGNADAADDNEKRMQCFAVALKLAWVCLIFAPIAALVVAAAAHP